MAVRTPVVLVDGVRKALPDGDTVAGLAGVNGEYSFDTGLSEDVGAKTVTATPFPVGSTFASNIATDPATLLGYGTWNPVSVQILDVDRAIFTWERLT